MQFSNGLFSVDELTSQQVQTIFSHALAFKSQFSKNATFSNTQLTAKTIALTFLEPSTRTRFSFEMACSRMGYKFVSFVGDSTTSMAKGEAARETLNTLNAMKPDLFVIRSGEDKSVEDFYHKTEVPCINAGFGKFHHPTQALLDVFTMQQQWGDLKGKKVLFLGDVEHSRVAHSNLTLLKLMGAEVSTTGPQELRAQGELWANVQHFNTLSEALSWCDVVMALRTQKERHATTVDAAKLLQPYQLNAESLKNLKSDTLIMHPAPFTLGEELTEEVLDDPRCFIYKQIENGVYIRAALLGLFLGDLH